MSDSSVYLLGLDIGSTTTHLMIARASLLKNCVTGRMELSSPEIVFKSEPVFTPFDGNEIDLASLSKQILSWIEQSRQAPAQLSGGGAIVTGLASQKENAQKIKSLVKELVSKSIVATAEDPHLESWLAFKGNCQTLSVENPSTLYLNFDIGGGTTNIAIGCNGEVRSTGCLFIGARHFQFKTGTYLLTQLSKYGERLLTTLGIFKKAGDTLLPNEIQAIAKRYASDLENIVLGKTTKEMESLYDYFPSEQLRKSARDAVVTFSGGVGELLYRNSREGKVDSVSAYGDFGEALANAVFQSPLLSKDLKSTVPTHLGRATVFGMTLYQVEVSGSTTYLSHEELLPLEDIPIPVTLDLCASDSELLSKLEFLYSAGTKLGVYLVCKQENAREQFTRLASLIHFPKNATVVFFLENNLGKTLGNYLTQWGNSDLKCIVVDEIPLKTAQFASLGRMLQNSIPVSFYGMK